LRRHVNQDNTSRTAEADGDVRRVFSKSKLENFARMLLFEGVSELGVVCDSQSHGRRTAFLV